ncbi:MAG: histidine kinase [Bacteroidia bacterium]
MNKTGEAILLYKDLLNLKGEDIVCPDELKILIVDDNIFDSELMRRELSKQSKIKLLSKVVTDKLSYEEALKTFLPDAVYCDYNISHNFNAIDAVRILKLDYPEVPFVLVTGSLSEEVVAVCMDEGIDDYVFKSNMSRLPLSLINVANKRKIELQKKAVYEQLVKSELEVRNFAKHLNETLEEERSHIAREIHDELGQQLAGIKMGISSLKKQCEETTNEYIDTILKDIDSTIQSLRKIATELRPGILDTLGLIPSIKWLAQEFEKKTKIDCELHCDVEDLKYEQTLSTCFFRICQEGLTNINKHAGANKVIITIKQEKNKLTLKIADNGKGIVSEKLENPFSMGLLGMRERAGIIKAHLLITSKKNMGTMIQLTAKTK